MGKSRQIFEAPFVVSLYCSLGALPLLYYHNYYYYYYCGKQVLNYCSVCGTQIMHYKYCTQTVLYNMRGVRSGTSYTVYLYLKLARISTLQELTLMEYVQRLVPGRQSTP